MTRMLRTLGLSFVAVLALSAMAATAAQAHTFKSAAEHTVLTGTNERNAEGKPIQDTFTVGGNEVKCEDSHFVGTQAEKEVNSLTIVPTYANSETKDGVCEAFGSAATVTVNHCAYVFSSETIEETPEQFHAHVNVECGPESEITIEAPTAFVTLHVPPQEGTKDGVIYHNIEEEYKEGKFVKAVTVQATVKNIKAKCTGFGCAFIGGENVVGEYESRDIITGYEDTKEVTGTAKTTQSSYEHGETPINIEVVGAPSTP